MTVREKTCTKCKKTKPLKEFKRTLTLAQSRALLKRPALKTPHETISALCESCRPNKLTAKKIQNLVFNGDINAVTGDYLKNKIRLELRQRQSMGMSKTWQKRKQEKIDTHVTPWHRNIRQQVAKKYNYYALQRARPKDPHLTDYAKMDYEIAKTHKARLDLLVRTGEGLTMDLFPHINDYYTAYDKAKLVQARNAIPKYITEKMKGTR